MPKTECNKEVPNVRFHFMDIRHYYTGIYQPEIEKENEDIVIMSKSLDILNSLDVLNNDLDITKKANIMLTTMNTIIKEIVENSSDLKEKININELPQKFPTIESESKLLEFKTFEIFKKHKEISLEIIKNRKKMIKQYIEIYNIIKKSGNQNYKLINTNMLIRLSNYLIPIHLDNEIKYFIKKYIADENGIYSDEKILKNAFELCKSIPRIERNIGNNKELIEKYYKIHNYFDITKKYDNGVIKNFLNDPDSIISDKETIFGIRWLILDFSSIIMDIYLLARTLKKFDPKKREETTVIKQEYANDIIIIAGDAHIKTYVEFYKNISSDILFNDESNERCVKNPSDILEKYYNI